jgi:hypothetical protein
MQAADWIALWSLVVACISLAVALFAILKGNRNASVATLVTLYEAIRQAWQRFEGAAQEDERWYELCELINLFEITAAILNEKSFAGHSKSLMKDLLEEALGKITGDAWAQPKIQEMLTSDTTFEHIGKFYKAKKADTLSITKPRQWFQT